MKTTSVILVSRLLGFFVVCAVVFSTGQTAGDVVWGLYISSMVSGVVALLLPLWVLMLSPQLERKLFPNHEPIEFSWAGRLFSLLVIALFAVGPFLFFMVLFTPFMIERVEVLGIPDSSESWFVFWRWALQSYWWMTVIISVQALYESTLWIFRGDGAAFFRPYVLILKMFAVVIVSNLGFNFVTIVPLVAILYLPEDWLIAKISER